MKIATIISTILLVVWIILTMLAMWTEHIDLSLYVKLSITLGILISSIIVIAIALREYGSEKKMKDHNYLD